MVRDINSNENVKGAEVDAFLRVSPEAVAHMESFIKTKGVDKAYMRLLIKRHGCAGFSYDLEYSEQSFPEDEELHLSDKLILCAPRDVKNFLMGMEIHYHESPCKSGFVFRNPNESGRCGCGLSFSM